MQTQQQRQQVRNEILATRHLQAGTIVSARTLPQTPQNTSWGDQKKYMQMMKKPRHLQ